MQITYQNPRKQAKADENENAVFSFLLFLGIGTFQRVAPDSNAFFSPLAFAPPDLPIGPCGISLHRFPSMARFSVFVKNIRARSFFRWTAIGC
jgi:hypothetical protein